MRAAWVRLWSAVVRYLPAEVAGTATMLTGAALVRYRYADRVWVMAVTAILLEAVGFYGVMAAVVVHEQWPQTVGLARRRCRTSGSTARLLVAEFGPAEVVDTFTRPPLTALALWLLGTGPLGLMVGKVASDLVFYAFAAVGYLVTVRFGWRRRAVRGARPARGSHPARGAR